MHTLTCDRGRLLAIVDELVVRNVLQLFDTKDIAELNVLHGVRAVLLVGDNLEGDLAVQEVRVSGHELKHLCDDRNAVPIRRIDNEQNAVNVRVKELPAIAVAALEKISIWRTYLSAQIVDDARLTGLRHINLLDIEVRSRHEELCVGEFVRILSGRSGAGVSLERSAVLLDESRLAGVV